MALELTSAITATAPEFRVTGTVPDTIEPGFRFRLDDELLSLQGFGEDESIRGGYARQWAPRDRQRWIVNRGIDSVAASHDAGTELLAANDAFGSSSDLTPPSPFSPGGGGLPEDWTQDPETGEIDAHGTQLLNLSRLATDRLVLLGVGATIFEQANDPSTAPGAAAALGSLILRTNGQAWLKTDVDVTDWTQIGGIPAGAFRVVRVPIAFDTPDLTFPGTGITVYTPVAGEVILWATGTYVSVSTPWDGTTPQINFTWTDLAGVFNYASLESADAVGSDGHTLIPPFIGLSSEDIGIFPDATSLKAIVDDTAGGAPGSTQGEGEIVLIVGGA